MLTSREWDKGTEELTDAGMKAVHQICDRLPGYCLPPDLSYEDVSTALVTVSYNHAYQLGLRYGGRWRLLSRIERQRILEEMTARIVADGVTVLLGLGLFVPAEANKEG